MAVVACVAVACGAGQTASNASPSTAVSETPSATPSPTPVPSATIPAGWTLVEKKTQTGQASFALPPTWRVIDLDADTVARSFAAIASANPDFGKAFTLDQMRSLGAAGLYVYGFDFDPTTASSGFLTNMNALTQATKVTFTLDSFAQLNAGQIEVQLKAKTISSTKVRVGALDGIRNVYEYSLNGAQGVTAVVVEQWYMIANSYPHVLSFTTAKSLYDTYKLVFEQIGMSYRAA